MKKKHAVKITSKILNEIFFFTGLAIASVTLYFIWLHKIPLWSSDEGRYAEIGREMWETKNFVVAQFNYVSYLEKPVLAPFTSALMFGLFGVNQVAARLPSIFSALAGIAIVYLFTRRLFDTLSAKLAALILLTSTGYVLVGRFAVIDMQMILLLSTSLFFLMTAFFENKQSHYLWAFFFMGLTILTKGIIGIVLPGLVFLTFLVWTGQIKVLKKIPLLWGILILSLVVIPWFISISIAEPEFFEVFIMEHHLKRFTGGSFGRVRPFWFFSYIILIISFPWILLIPSAIAKGLARSNVFRDKIKFLICWAATIFIFFSIPKSKLPYYVVPICVPVAILAATFLAEWRTGKLSTQEERRLSWVWVFIVAVCFCGFMALILVPFIVKEPEVLALSKTIFAAAFIFVIGGAVCLWGIKKKKKALIFNALTGMTYFVILIVISGMVTLSPQQSTASFAEAIQSEPETLIAVYASPDHFSDLPFHLKRRIMVIGSDRGTLNQESREEEHLEDSKNWFVTASDFGKIFNESDSRVYCLLENEKLAQLLQLSKIENYHIIKESHGTLLLSNKNSS